VQETWVPLRGGFARIHSVFLHDSELTAQDSKVLGEVAFQGDTSVDRDSGVWIDGEYVGYVKELKGHKKGPASSRQTRDFDSSSRVCRSGEADCRGARTDPISSGVHEDASRRADSGCHGDAQADGATETRRRFS